MILIVIAGKYFIDISDSPQHKNTVTIFSLLALFVPLVFFKYTDFIYLDIIGHFIEVDGPLLNVPLPLGLSFITFTLTAYLIETSRKKFTSDHSLADLASYVLFFPHLVAGPIIRPGELIPQLRNPLKATFRDFKLAFTLFTLGLTKKLVIADQVATVVNAVYGQPVAPSAPEAALAIVAFSVQIYCDFSGYTDMAIGLALMLGVTLPVNFARPYCAYSISELWRRWHMTLTRFLMDYVYTPLSLKLMRFAAFRRYPRWVTVGLALIVPVNITFLASGIWHGAGWNFVLFGLATGIALSVHMVWKEARLPALPKPVAWFLTMLAFLFTLAIFRARSLDEALAMVTVPVTGSWDGTMAVLSENVFVILLIAVFGLTHRFDDHGIIKQMLGRVPQMVTWTFLAFCWVLAVALSHGNSADFIYFDF